MAITTQTGQIFWLLMEQVVIRAVMGLKVVRTIAYRAAVPEPAVTLVSLELPHRRVADVPVVPAFGDEPALMPVDAP